MEHEINVTIADAWSGNLGQRVSKRLRLLRHLIRLASPEVAVRATSEVNETMRHARSLALEPRYLTTAIHPLFVFTGAEFEEIGALRRILSQPAGRA